MLDALGSPWLPCLVLIILAAVARQVRGSWLSPGPLIALVWAVYVTACLVLTDYTVYASGIWIVVLFVFSIQFGTVLSEGLDARSTYSGNDCAIGPETLAIWQNRSRRFGLLFAVAGLVGCVHLLFLSLVKFSLDFSLLSMLSLGHLWSVARYQRGEVEPWSVRLLIMWVYPSVLLAGISFALAPNRARKWQALTPLVPAALIGTIFAARAGLLISVICWFSGLFAVRYRQTGGTYALFQRKLVLSLVLLIIGGLLFFVGIDTVRTFQGGDLKVGTDAPRLSKYFFGAVPAFADWVHTSEEQGMTMGAFTFAGVFDLLGVRPREIGVYQELQTLAGGEETNIYTVFRGLIQDFTLPGGVLFGVLLGIVAGTAARPGSTNQLRNVMVLAGYYAFVIYSPVISLFVYNGLILAWGVAALVLGFRTHQRPLEGGMVPSTA
jgi:oligosaccharide repeat unit polymerase